MGNKTRTATSAARRPKRERMLAGPDVRRRHDSLARGSAITADVMLRRPGTFCRAHSTTPTGFAGLGMRDLRAAAGLTGGRVARMGEQGCAPGRASGLAKAAKSWLAHFGAGVRRRIRAKDPSQAPALRDGRVPGAQEMAGALAGAALRTSAMISPMAEAGLRPEVMGNHDGTDGLRMRDLPDVVIHRGVARRIHAPCQIMARGELSKAGHQYFTFLTASGTNKLLAYLNDRLARGRPLHGDSAVIAPDHTRPLNRGRNSPKAFLPTMQISKEIRNTFRPRFPWRPYIMRAYYDTELLIAEARGKMAHDFRVFFMGHKGPVEARHATSNGMLPEALAREMRDAFARSEPLPGLEAQATAPEADRRQEMHDLVQGAAAAELGPMPGALRRAGKGGPARPSQTLTVPSG